MYKRSHLEHDRGLSKSQGLPFLNCFHIIRNSLIAFYHRKSPGVAYYGNFRIGLADKGNQCRVVRLHMVYYQEVYLSVPYFFTYIVQKIVTERCRRSINQRNLFIYNKI